MNLNTLGMHLRYVVELLLEQNVLARDVGEHKVELGLVMVIQQALLDHLQHWRDAGATRHHTNRLFLVRLVRNLLYRPLKLEEVTRRQTGNVLAEVALRI